MCFRIGERWVTFGVCLFVFTVVRGESWSCWVFFLFVADLVGVGLRFFEEFIFYRGLGGDFRSFSFDFLLICLLGEDGGVYVLGK